MKWRRGGGAGRARAGELEGAGAGYESRRRVGGRRGA